MTGRFSASILLAVLLFGCAPPPAAAHPVIVVPTVTPFLNTSLPSARNDPNDLVGAKIFDTGPYLADNKIHQLTWTNESGLRLLVKKSLLWTGVDLGGRMDVSVRVERSDGSRMNILGIDRYAEPVGPTVQVISYDPYFAIEPGESLTLIYFANKFSDVVTHAHHEFDMWWNYQTP